MAQPNLELVQEKVESSLNSTSSLGTWPPEGQAPSRGPRTAMMVGALALVLSLGGTMFQMMQLRKMNETLTAKIKGLEKAMDADRKKNNVQTLVGEAMDKLQKQTQDSLDAMKKDLTQMHNDGMTVLGARIDDMAKAAAASRAPASRGKAKGKAGKKRRH